MKTFLVGKGYIIYIIMRTLYIHMPFERKPAVDFNKLFLKDSS